FRLNSRVVTWLPWLPLGKLVMERKGVEPSTGALRVDTPHRPLHPRPAPEMQTPRFVAGAFLLGGRRGADVGAGGDLAAAIALLLSSAARLRPLDRTALAILVDFLFGPRALVRPGHSAGRKILMFDLVF